MTNTQPKPRLTTPWEKEEIIDNVIFLDIDGVLNSQITDRIFHGFVYVDTGKIAVLKELVSRTNAKIVLSSTWRGDYYWAQRGGVQQTYNLFELLRSELAAQELHISDMTDDIWDLRGLEIKSYLDTHPTIKHFVILDDDNGYPLASHQIKTSWNYGLLYSHIRQAEEILKLEYSPISNYIIREDKIGDQYYTYYADGSMIQGCSSLLKD